ncbi:hypothetical protein GCM10025865_10530 [Paraoerskovia sediminicola]|uniref:DUF11 domain-containing protein n=1 Tax=Paraoerskovia sediminicola TaxID=1138587 RepID=A0ABN6XAF2_9CELL|nr:hypothetical protein GCM10025865_10530 [Paraoerskovia sediminicola]
MLYNKPIPATAGISFTFDQYQYGGTGADGIGFFLVDGSTNLTAPGADGGSLGYAQRNGTPGIAGGYLGVGMDSYGNFYNDGEARGKNCAIGSHAPTAQEGPSAPNVITLRGPGTGTDGYCWIDSTVEQPIQDPDRPVSTLNYGNGTLRGADLAAGFRTINVQVTPKTPGAQPGDAGWPHVIVQVQYPGSTDWVQELDVAAPIGGPDTYKFGLSASTGGSTDVHLVRGVTVDTIVKLNDLNLEKQVDRSGAPLPAVITAGTQIPYLYTVTNAGSETLDALSIVDDKIATADITCPTDPLPPAPATGSTVTCTGTYTVTDQDVADGAVTNIATAHATAPIAGDIVSNEATVTVPLVSSIELAKGVITPAPYAVGQTVLYEYEVTNTGGSTVSALTVSDDRIPDQANMFCASVTIQPGDMVTCVGTYVLAAGDVAADGTLTNTAQATARTPIGQEVVSNEDQATIPVYTDVAVTKTVDEPTPVVGDDVVYTVTATNDGPSVADGVVVTDALPGGLTFVSADPAADYDETSGAWAVGSLDVGDSATLRLTATVDAGSQIVNTATRTATTQVDIDPSNDTATATIDPVTPTLDIAVEKGVLDASGTPQDTGEVLVGDEATFRVTATNNGPFAGTDVTLTDTLPAGLTYVPGSSSGDGTYDAATGVWDIGALAVNASATYDFVVTGSTLGTYTNVATLTTSTPTDTVSSNNEDSATLTVRGPRADLAVTKQVDGQDSTTAKVGDTVTYTIEATNDGADPVEDVVVTDAIPAGVSAVPGTPTQGTVTADGATWTVGDLAVGQTETLTVAGTLTASGTHVNTVVIDSTQVDFVDVDPSNDTASASVDTDEAQLDVAVTKDVDSPTVLLGDQATFTITATNDGGPNGVVADDVVLTDVFPAGLSIDASSASAGTFDESTGVWTIPTLGVGDAEAATLTITATADAVGVQDNTVSLTSLKQTDTDPDNNADSAQVQVVEESDLVLTKDVSTPTAQPGDTVDWTVTVRNDGPNDNRGVVVGDTALVGADVTKVDAPSGTSFEETTGVWTVGDLAVGDSRTLTVTVTVPDGAQGDTLNTATITAHEVTDPDLTNNTDDATYTVPVADVAVVKSVDLPQVYVGDEVTFTVGVDNLGPDAADAVTVDDVLPAGLSYVSSSATVGSYDATAGLWTVGDLTVDADPATHQAELTVVAKADAAGTATNTATSDRSKALPYDPDLANNEASATVTAVEPPADLAVTKTVDRPQVEVGSGVTYTLTVTNLGPGTATDATVTDPFPAGVTPSAVDAGPGASCTLSGQDVACDLGDMAVGDTRTVQVAATGDTAGTLTNTATVSTTAVDPVTANDTASADLVVVEPAVVPGGGTDHGNPLAVAARSRGPVPTWCRSPSARACCSCSAPGSSWSRASAGGLTSTEDRAPWGTLGG